MNNQPFTSVALFNNNNKQEGTQQPDYNLVARREGDEKGTTVGAAWNKDTGSIKFISASLNSENKTYQKKDGSQGEEKAYVIITKDQYNDLMRIAGDATQTLPEKSGVDTSMMEDIDPESIPF